MPLKLRFGLPIIGVRVRVSGPLASRDSYEEPSDSLKATLRCRRVSQLIICGVANYLAQSQPALLPYASA